MQFREIRDIDITIKCDCGNKYHESVTRSFHILDKVEELIKLDTPKEVLLEIIEDLRSARK